MLYGVVVKTLRLIGSELCSVSGYYEDGAYSLGFITEGKVL
jgi:hypothetical protein